MSPNVLDGAMLRAARALRLDTLLEQWLAGGDGRLAYISHSLPCGGEPGAWLVTLGRPGREPVSAREADRLDAISRALCVVMIERQEVSHVAAE